MRMVNGKNRNKSIFLNREAGNSIVRKLFGFHENKEKGNDKRKD
jgi:hypothetical protein